MAFHGSWNSDIKVGYKVSLFPFHVDQSGPTGFMLDVIYEPDTAGCGNSCLRPVNAIFDLKGHLYVSADSSGEIFKVTYDPEATANKA